MNLPYMRMGNTTNEAQIQSLSTTSIYSKLSIYRFAAKDKRTSKENLVDITANVKLLI